MNGKTQDTPTGVAKAFTDFYTKLLGTSTQERDHVCGEVVRKGAVLSEEQQQMLQQNITAREIKKVVWSIPGEKLLGS